MRITKLRAEGNTISYKLKLACKGSYHIVYTIIDYECLKQIIIFKQVYKVHTGKPVLIKYYEYLENKCNICGQQKFCKVKDCTDMSLFDCNDFFRFF